MFVVVGAGANVIEGKALKGVMLRHTLSCPEKGVGGGESNSSFLANAQVILPKYGSKITSARGLMVGLLPLPSFSRSKTEV